MRNKQSKTSVGEEVEEQEKTRNSLWEALKPSNPSPTIPETPKQNNVPENAMSQELRKIKELEIERTQLRAQVETKDRLLRDCMKARLDCPNCKMHLASERFIAELDANNKRVDS